MHVLEAYTNGSIHYDNALLLVYLLSGSAIILKFIHIGHVVFYLDFAAHFLYWVNLLSLCCPWRGLWTSSLSITRELGSDAEPQAPWQP